MPAPHRRGRRRRIQPGADIHSLVAQFGATIALKKSTNSGENEDRIRAPFERLMEDYGKLVGLRVIPSGEVLLTDLGVKPDYAIEVYGARIGYVELKAPGRLVPGLWKPRSADKAQWEKLKLLPNVLYTDGQCWALFRSGERVGEPAWLSSDVETAGSKLRPADDKLEILLQDFLTWEPERPRTVRELVTGVATLCRLLRDEVVGILNEEDRDRTRPKIFSRLANEWRGLLFPNLTDAQFANDYAQTVTFALLLARVEGIDFEHRSIGEIALILGKKHSLMGRALGVLVNDTVERDSVVIDTMLRIVGAVDWDLFEQETYLTLFQHFLMEYDPEQRKRTGSYYTPDKLVRFMVRFVDDLLVEELDRPRGFASNNVIVVDPAMGTGSFLAQILERAAETIGRLEGPGQIPPRLRSLSRRVMGFEKQVAPYAISQLRLHTLLKKVYGAEPPREDFKFLTDTLDNPDIQELEFGSMYEEISQSRRAANRVKRDTPVMVVISNPPFHREAAGLARWITDPGDDRVGRPNLDAFRLPGNGKYEYVLSSLSTYFWRWATWKVFDAHPAEPSGVVAFVSTASFLDAIGFSGMRKYLRSTADEGWIVDLSPEAFRPPGSLRVFPENGNRVCVAIFIRRGRPAPRVAARINYLSVAGTRDEKLDQLSAIRIKGGDWELCPRAWEAPMLPDRQDSTWIDMPSLLDLFPRFLPGVKPNRTWLYAPTPDVLRRRWNRLVAAPLPEKVRLFKETSSRKIDSKPIALPGYPLPGDTVADEKGECPAPARVAFRAFDRHWTIPDARLHHRPSPDLWRVAGAHQIYITEQYPHAFTEGPGLLFTAEPPDIDHFLGRGGRVLPLFVDQSDVNPNIAPGVLEYLRGVYGREVDALDLLGYVAAVVSHRGYIARFAGNLHIPGIRVPLTKSAALWTDSVSLGKKVVFVQTYGKRGSYPGLSTSELSSWLPEDRRPRVEVEIPDSPENMPEDFSYDSSAEVLRVGDGVVSRIPPAVWEYKVGSNRVLKKWLEYRMSVPAYRWSTPLNDVVLDRWEGEMTGELLELVVVLSMCIRLESQQSNLLDRICDSDTITLLDFAQAGVHPVPHSAKRFTRAVPPNALTLPAPD